MLPDIVRSRLSGLSVIIATSGGFAAKRSTWRLLKLLILSAGLRVGLEDQRMSDAESSRAGSVFGPYRLKRLLGRGGMGEVYEAEHTVKEWTVAVKLMSDQFSKDPVFRERMKREARIAGRLQEPHVVPIHDYGEIDGKMFMEMRLIEGTDLDSLLKRFGPLTPPRAVAIISQIGSALDAAHAAGVMHRDIKPPNILVTREDFAYLVDFGIASATTDEKLTQLGTAVGTWKYMAPERFSNGEVTYRADIYALACVLHEALTGAPPYRADSASVLVTSHLLDPVPQPSTQRAGIPKALDGVIARGMAKKPEDRYASAGDLAVAAHEALSDPDQANAQNILRRSTEATIPGSAGPAQHTGAPPPSYTRQPSSYTPQPSSHTPQPSSHTPPTNTPPPAYGPGSGPVPTPSHQQPPYFPGGGGTNWPGQPPGVPPQQTGQQPGGWGQAPPPKKRSPLPIVLGVAALVVVLVIAAIVVFVVIIPKPKPVAKPISADPQVLAALLMSSSEVNGIMGASNMTPSKPITSMDTSTSVVSVPSCLGALYTGETAVYGGTGYTAISGLVHSEDGDRIDHFVDEAVVTYPTADQAKTFLQTSQDKWKACKTLTVTNNKGKTFRWTFAQATGGPPTITQNRTQEAAGGWACQHVMSQANNVIVDLNACTYSLGDQASQLASKIVDKINSQS
jgi:serine/threonine protein kinase